jgi:cyclase
MNYKIFLMILTSLISICVNNPKKEFSPKNFDLIKISDGVFACIHKFGGKTICNSGIVDNGESTIIFDTFLSPDAAEELIETVKYLKLSPVKYVINSH